MSHLLEVRKSFVEMCDCQELPFPGTNLAAMRHERIWDSGKRKQGKRQGEGKVRGVGIQVAGTAGKVLALRILVTAEGWGEAGILIARTLDNKEQLFFVCF